MAKLLTALMLVSLTACTMSGGLFSRSTRSSEESQSDTAPDSGGLSIYLQIMGDLVEGDAVTQAETFQRVSADAAATPTTTNRLKLALALATPGHPGSNAEHAQRELRELLAIDELLLPEERLLAVIQLEDVEQRLILELEAQQVRGDLQDTIEQQTSSSEQRIAALQDENRRLRAQLEEAQELLDEITNIERSIRERESDSN